MTGGLNMKVKRLLVILLVLLLVLGACSNTAPEDENGDDDVVVTDPQPEPEPEPEPQPEPEPEPEPEQKLGYDYISNIQTNEFYEREYEFMRIVEAVDVPKTEEVYRFFLSELSGSNPRHAYDYYRKVINDQVQDNQLFLYYYDISQDASYKTTDQILESLDAGLSLISNLFGIEKEMLVSEFQRINAEKDPQQTTYTGQFENELVTVNGEIGETISSPFVHEHAGEATQFIIELEEPQDFKLEDVNNLMATIMNKGADYHDFYFNTDSRIGYTFENNYTYDMVFYRQQENDLETYFYHSLKYYKQEDSTAEEDSKHLETLIRAFYDSIPIELENKEESIQNSVKLFKEAMEDHDIPDHNMAVYEGENFVFNLENLLEEQSIRIVFHSFIDQDNNAVPEPLHPYDRD